MDEVAALNRFATADLEPDLVVYLTAPLDVLRTVGGHEQRLRSRHDRQLATEQHSAQGRTHLGGAGLEGGHDAQPGGLEPTYETAGLGALAATVVALEHDEPPALPFAHRSMFRLAHAAASDARPEADAPSDRLAACTIVQRA